MSATVQCPYTFTPTDFHSCKALRAQILCPQYLKNHIACHFKPHGLKNKRYENVVARPQTPKINLN